MRVNKKTKNISLFFLLAFLFIRIADLHSYSHFSDDDLTHCELCEIIITSNQFTPLLDSPFIEEKTHQDVVFHVIKVDLRYKTPYYSITQPEIVYNKPPPIL